MTYTLYGSYASYYTAKSRSLLRKKGIPFVERLPSESRFRDTVRPTSGSHRIPQLLTPDGQVIQDSVEILDHVEATFPEIPAFPATPSQRAFTHLMELLGSEGLVTLAWQHRWLFPDNLNFIKKDFGRSFRPQGSDEELVKYGSLIADRMMSYGLPPTSEAIRENLDTEYLAILTLLESHLQRHPYLLGGHPSAADYAIMGAMHAHLGRDPAGLHFMQQHAPRVFRWVEHMLTPEIQSPEFYDTPIVYPKDDRIPETALNFLRHIAERYGNSFILSSLAFQQAMDQLKPTSGYALAPDTDQPTLDAMEVSFQGHTYNHKANLHHVWLAQRAQCYFQGLSDTQRQTVEKTLNSAKAGSLLNAPTTWRIQRRDNRLFVQ
jgi:glutathione S-transferase